MNMKRRMTARLNLEHTHRDILGPVVLSDQQSHPNTFYTVHLDCLLFDITTL
jgi:hypothetical protein